MKPSERVNKNFSNPNILKLKVGNGYGTKGRGRRIHRRRSKPLRDWLERLDPQVRAMIAVAIERLADGNKSNVKSIGEGAAELKINRGPGYRVYFGRYGNLLVILLGGGTKQRQQNDIDAALRRWREYKSRAEQRTR